MPQPTTGVRGDCLPVANTSESAEVKRRGHTLAQPALLATTSPHDSAAEDLRRSSNLPTVAPTGLLPSSSEIAACPRAHAQESSSSWTYPLEPQRVCSETVDCTAQAARPYGSPLRAVQLREKISVVCTVDGDSQLVRQCVTSTGDTDERQRARRFQRSASAPAGPPPRCPRDSLLQRPVRELQRRRSPTGSTALSIAGWAVAHANSLSRERPHHSGSVPEADELECLSDHRTFGSDAKQSRRLCLRYDATVRAVHSAPTAGDGNASVSLGIAQKKLSQPSIHRTGESQSPVLSPTAPTSTRPVRLGCDALLIPHPPPNPNKWVPFSRCPVHIAEENAIGRGSDALDHFPVAFSAGNDHQLGTGDEVDVELVQKGDEPCATPEHRLHHTHHCSGPNNGGDTSYVHDKEMIFAAAAEGSADDEVTVRSYPASPPGRRGCPPLGGGGGDGELQWWDDFGYDTGHRSSWKDQLGAALSRDMLERRRRWRGVLLEVVIPLVCVTGAVALWAAFGVSSCPLFSNASQLGEASYDFESGAYITSLCYNETWRGKPNYVSGLLSCSELVSGWGKPVVCTTTGEEELPVKGLCYVSDEWAMIGFIGGMRNGMSKIMPLDDIIAYQWLAKKMSWRNSVRADLLVGAGIHSNTRYSAIQSGGKLYFAPSENVSEEMVGYFTRHFSLFQHVYGGTFDSAAKARRVIKDGKHGPTWALINVHQLDENGLGITIDMGASAMPKFSLMVDPGYQGGPSYDRSDVYYASGFPSLVNAMVQYYLGTFSAAGATREEAVAIEALLGDAVRQLEPLTVGATAMLSRKIRGPDNASTSDPAASAVSFRVPEFRGRGVKKEGDKSRFPSPAHGTSTVTPHASTAGQDATATTAVFEATDPTTASCTMERTAQGINRIAQNGEERPVEGGARVVPVSSLREADGEPIPSTLTWARILHLLKMRVVLRAKANVTLYTDGMPWVPYQTNHLMTTASSAVSFVLVLSFLYPVSQLTRRLVLEKELRMREAMKIMGLNSGYMWCSWFLYSVALMFLISFLVTVLMCTTFMVKSDPFCVFMIIFMFALTCIPLAGLLAAFFDTARMASLMTPLIFFAMAVPVVAMRTAVSRLYLGLSMFSPTAFSLLLTIAFTRESGAGFSAEVFHDPEDSPNTAALLVCMTVDFFVYLALMFYLDAVLPRALGVVKHPLYFILDPLAYYRCWRNRRAVHAAHQQGQRPRTEEREGDEEATPTVERSFWCCNDAADDAEGDDADGRDPSGVYEPEECTPDEIAVRFVGLRKVFRRRGRLFTAVRNFTWQMPHRGISVLLGHNGAGKSTVINMMTGMLSPDGGDCYICGHSVRRALTRARHEIGFCPQHNILWPGLTCKEHLEFFGHLKGLHGAALNAAVTRMLAEVDLLDKAHEPSCALSGGMKRKLSVAIAFVGGSRLVILDEPTAGMDVEARRDIWELLLRMSQRCSVLLTTHFMDEADLLGDRVAIMSHGQLRCSGSSLFLKSRLGMGYNISISVDMTQPSHQLDALLRQHVSQAECLSSCGGEVKYRLPAQQLEKFSGLLRALDTAGARLGVRGYAISPTTLEEIFLKLTKDASTAAWAGSTADQVGRKARWWKGSPRRRASALWRRLCSCLGSAAEDSDDAESCWDGDEGPLEFPTYTMPCVSGEPYGRSSDASRSSAPPATLSSGAANSHGSRSSQPHWLSSERSESFLAHVEVPSAMVRSSTVSSADDSITFHTIGIDTIAAPISNVGFNGSQCLALREPLLFSSNDKDAQGNANRRDWGSRGRSAGYQPAVGTPAVPSGEAPCRNVTGEEPAPPLSDGSSTAPMQRSPADAIWNREVCPEPTTLALVQMRAMMIKRFSNAKRDRRMLCFQVICPVACVLLAVLLSLFHPYSVRHLAMDTASYPYETLWETSGCGDFFSSSADATASLLAPNLRMRDINALSLLDFYHYLQDAWYHHGGVGKYGALACGQQVVEALRGAGANPVVIMTNYSAYHELPISMVNFYNLLFKDARGTSAVSISVEAGTFPTASSVISSDSMKLLLMGVVIMVPFTFLPSNYVVWIVKERECKSRHLQELCGLHYLVYWGSNFIFDVAAYLVTLLLVMLIFAVFRRTEYVGTDTVGATLCLLLMFGFSSIATAYCLQFFFHTHSNAQSTTLAFGFVTGFLLVIVVFVLDMIPRTQAASRMMRKVCRIFPTYAVGEGIVNLAMLDQLKSSNPSLTAFSLDVVGWPCVYMAIESPLFLIITLLLDHPYWRRWWLLRHYIHDADTAMQVGDHRCDERGGHRRPFPSPGEVSRDAAAADEEGSGVEDERAQVQQCLRRYLEARQQRSYQSKHTGGGLRDLEAAVDEAPAVDAVAAVGLRKTYGNGKLAVQDLTFGVIPGEVFGLLGTNGAGKTTVMGMLCQDIFPTAGRLYVCGHNAIEESAVAMQCIGYCPQFDATLDFLTVEEHLRVFAGIRGIVPGPPQDSVVKALLRLCGLREYRHTTSANLSGGNRRKLSVALSIVGGPQVVVLDEPSAGMDPVARREMWSSIQTFKNRCSIILCTHHLEEVEALADCVAIMVGGRLRCIGSKTYLKNKYGSGVELIIRVQPLEEVERSPQRTSLSLGDHLTSPVVVSEKTATMEQRVISFVTTSFPSSTLKDSRGKQLVFALPKQTPLSAVFKQVQAHRSELCISDYTVSHTSIEQVLLRVSGDAGAQAPPSP